MKILSATGRPFAPAVETAGARFVPLMPNTWPDQVADFVARAPEPVVLVGHSGGGLVVSEAAERVSERIRSLVYVSGSLVPDGVSMFEATSQVPRTPADQDAMVVAPDGTSTIRREAVRRIFYNTTAPEWAARAEARLGREPLEGFTARAAAADAGGAAVRPGAHAADRPLAVLLGPRGAHRGPAGRRSGDPARPTGANERRSRNMLLIRNAPEMSAPPPASGAPKTCRLFGVLVTCLLAAPATAKAPAPFPMQTPEAQSVGTSTNLHLAAQTLLAQFDRLAGGGGRLSLRQAEAALPAPNGGGRDATREAVRFFLASPIARQLAGEAGWSGLTRAGLAAAVAASASPRLDGQLRALATAAADHDGARFYARLLADPGVPDAVRQQILRDYSDDELLQLYGRPVVQGDARDTRDVTAAFLYFIRVSWLGAAEAEAIVRDRVTYTMLRGGADHNASYWNGRVVQLSEKMLTGGTGVVTAQALAGHIGIFAHESGHGISALSGLQTKLDADMDRHHITGGMKGVVGEALAGVFGNRAQVAGKGFGTDKDGNANLAFAHDVEKNIASPTTFYAKHYHVDVAQAQAQLPLLKQLIADDLIPVFQEQFALLGDPQLTLTLPPAHR